MARAYCGPYAASKAALNALVRTYATEAAASNVRVNLFSPGPTYTRMYRSGWPGVDPATLPTPETGGGRDRAAVHAGLQRERQGLRLSRGEISGISRAVLTRRVIGAQSDVPILECRLSEAKRPWARTQYRLAKSQMTRSRHHSTRKHGSA